MALLELTVGNFLSLFVAHSAAAHFTAVVAVATYSSALTFYTVPSQAVPLSPRIAAVVSCELLK